MRNLVGIAIVVLSTAAAAPAQAQMFTITNLGGGSLSAGETNLDLNNTAVALSNGGFRAGAVSLLGQSATNQLNVLDLLGTFSAMAAAAPLSGVIQLNMLMGTQPVSLTTVNTSGAIAAGINPIVGTTQLNTPWTGGYGGASGGALVGGSQSGLNTINGASVALAPGSTFSLVQQAGPLALLPLMQTAMLNAAVSNTWIASSLNGGATINGALGTVSPGAQWAGITVNGALLSGGGTIDVQQLGALSHATFQSVNRAGAFSNTALTPIFSLR